MEAKNVSLRVYNSIVRRIAEVHTMELGMIDDPAVRVARAAWLRRIRKELPYHQHRRVA